MKRNKNAGDKSGRQSIDAVIKSICDVMRRGGMAGALEYVPELSWLLFLRILQENEAVEEQRCKALKTPFSPILASPYRWQDWAAKNGAHRRTLEESAGNALLKFINDDLLPHLKSFSRKHNATDQQKVISQIFRNMEKTRFTTQRDMLDVLDRIDELRQSEVDDTHIFTLSQVYESLLLKMGEKNNDGGQFFTPREVIRVIIRAVNPKVGETVYDPCCGTGGFLAQANEYMRAALGKAQSAENLTTLSKNTFYGREKADLIYPIALANLVLHGINIPRIWHGNALTRAEIDGTLYSHDEQEKPHDVILTNPPFGGKESKQAQTRFDFKTSSTQVLFMQEVIAALKRGGRCGIVVDEGFLFRADGGAFTNTKRRLLEQCDLWCIISLPGGVFTQAGAGVKTNLLFFTKGKPTEKIWYYDLSHVKVTKRQPLTSAHFAEFFKLLPKRADSENSWSIGIETIKEKNYDLKAVNPNRKIEIDTRTPAELVNSIEARGKEIADALAELRKSIQ